MRQNCPLVYLTLDLCAILLIQNPAHSGHCSEFGYKPLLRIVFFGEKPILSLWFFFIKLFQGIKYRLIGSASKTVGVDGTINA